jgi:Icc-related predicted phosphoesterase
MKLCIISDTHDQHEFISLPEADCIIHCGDMSLRGTYNELKNFMDWFSNLSQYKYKICIAGNHDWLFERDPNLAKTLIPKNVIYLEDSKIEIDGVMFYGTPAQKIFCNWAFNKNEYELIKHWSLISDDTDVLITHQPPYGVRDCVIEGSNEGSKSLWHEVINRIKPKIHCFGHIHESYGMLKQSDITFVNASVLDAEYYCVNEPILIEIQKQETYI